jgi:cysteine desulfurase
MLKKGLNLDANASYGTLPGVLDEAIRLTEDTLNPSSIHAGGQRAKALIEEARDTIAQALSIKGRAHIIFTSGASEANNLALMLPFWQKVSAPEESDALVTTELEHPSVLEVARRLQSWGVPVHFARPNPKAALAAARVTSLVDSKTALVSMMYANNESGEVLCVSEVAREAKSKNPRVLIHTDAVQAFGKVPLSWADLGVDMLSLSAHKIGGLPGVGALVVDKAVPCQPLLLGGPQEKRWRAGTENVLGIVSFGLATKVMLNELAHRRSRMLSAKDCIGSILRAKIPTTQIHLEGAATLPNTLSVRFPGVRADDLVVALDLKGILVSSGAACASGKPDPSHVLLAMGYSAQEARETVRISVRGDLEEAAAKDAAFAIVETVQRFASKREH